MRQISSLKDPAPQTTGATSQAQECQLEDVDRPADRRRDRHLAEGWQAWRFLWRLKQFVDEVLGIKSNIDWFFFQQTGV